MAGAGKGRRGGIGVGSHSVEVVEPES